MENNNTPAVKNTAKHSVKGFIAALNAKRKKLMLSISTMVAMSMVTAISAFAEGGGAGTSNAGEEQFNTVIQFFCYMDRTYRSCCRLYRRSYVRSGNQER